MTCYSKFDELIINPGWLVNGSSSNFKPRQFSKFLNMYLYTQTTRMAHLTFICVHSNNTLDGGLTRETNLMVDSHLKKTWWWTHTWKHADPVPHVRSLERHVVRRTLGSHVLPRDRGDFQNNYPIMCRTCMEVFDSAISGAYRRAISLHKTWFFGLQHT